MVLGAAADTIQSLATVVPAALRATLSTAFIIATHRTAISALPRRFY
jgi:hypothetical protein